MLFGLALEEIPATTLIVSKIGPYVLLFNADVSVWYAGLAQFYAGLGILGTFVFYPPNPLLLDEDAIAWSRYVAGRFLLSSLAVLRLMDCG